MFGHCGNDATNDRYGSKNNQLCSKHGHVLRSREAVWLLQSGNTNCGDGLVKPCSPGFGEELFAALKATQTGNFEGVHGPATTLYAPCHVR